MDMGGATGGIAEVISVLKYILIVLGGGILLGAVGGMVYAGIRYPNPNKRSLFSAKQKIILLAAGVVAVALIIYAFLPKPEKPADDVGASVLASAMLDEATGMPMTDEQGRVIGQDGNALTDENGNYLNSDGTPWAGEEESTAGEADAASPDDSVEQASSDGEEEESSAEEASSDEEGLSSEEDSSGTESSGEEGSSSQQEASGEESASSGPSSQADAPSGGSASINGGSGGSSGGGNISVLPAGPMIGGGAVVIR